MLAVLLIALGCGRRFYIPPPPTLPADVDRFVAIADEAAERMLAEFNLRPEAARLGGPFQLHEYGRVAVADRVGDAEVVKVYYQLRRPVDFIGHPQQFVVWVDRHTERPRVFGGRLVR